MANWVTLKNGVHIDLDDPENPITGSGTFESYQAKESSRLTGIAEQKGIPKENVFKAAALMEKYGMFGPKAKYNSKGVVPLDKDTYLKLADKYEKEYHEYKNSLTMKYDGTREKPTREEITKRNELETKMLDTKYQAELAGKDYSKIFTPEYEKETLKNFDKDDSWESVERALDYVRNGRIEKFMENLNIDNAQDRKDIRLCLQGKKDLGFTDTYVRDKFIQTFKNLYIKTKK